MNIWKNENWGLEIKDISLKNLSGFFLLIVITAIVSGILNYFVLAFVFKWLVFPALVGQIFNIHSFIALGGLGYTLKGYFSQEYYLNFFEEHLKRIKTGEIKDERLANILTLDSLIVEIHQAKSVYVMYGVVKMCYSSILKAIFVLIFLHTFSSIFSLIGW